MIIYLIWNDGDYYGPHLQEIYINLEKAKSKAEELQARYSPPEYNWINKDDELRLYKTDYYIEIRELTE